jgi:hypothetical protein
MHSPLVASSDKSENRMSLFGNGNTEKINQLSEELLASKLARKELKTALVNEKKKVGELTLKSETALRELERLKRVLLRVKQRQKASVDRANRFKSKLLNIESDI